jgi:hypothetical protein
MILLRVLLTLDEGTLKEIETFVLLLLDVVLSLSPLSYFLLLHQLATKSEACLVGGGRKGVFESSLLSHAIN